MSEAVFRTVPRIVLQEEGHDFVAHLNRRALALISVLESAAQRRRDRRLLAAMSDRDLSDIGIGRGEMDGAVQCGRRGR
jgi:uncharacterized protein YjiS (DUF1127 family)